MDSRKAYGESERVLKDGIRLLTGRDRDSLRDLLAGQYLERAQYAQAVEVYRQMDTIGEAERQMAIVFAFTVQKNHTDAIQALHAALSGNRRVSELDFAKGLPNAYLLLAHNFHMTGDDHRARRIVQDALAQGLVTLQQVDETGYLPNSLKIPVGQPH